MVVCTCKLIEVSESEMATELLQSNSNAKTDISSNQAKPNTRPVIKIKTKFFSSLEMYF